MSKRNSGGCGNNCNTVSKAPQKISLLSLLAIALLPKCPFCVMAYSGAVTLCSGKMLFPNSGSSSIYIFMLLCAMVIAGLILNYKDGRTKMSIVISLIGTFLIIASQYYLMNSRIFYGGVALLFFATWHNGSFYFLMRYFFNKKRIKNT